MSHASLWCLIILSCLLIISSLCSGFCHVSFYGPMFLCASFCVSLSIIFVSHHVSSGLGVSRHALLSLIISFLSMFMLYFSFYIFGCVSASPITSCHVLSYLLAVFICFLCLHSRSCFILYRFCAVSLNFHKFSVICPASCCFVSFLFCLSLCRGIIVKLQLAQFGASSFGRLLIIVYSA